MSLDDTTWRYRPPVTRVAGYDPAGGCTVAWYLVRSLVQHREGPGFAVAGVDRQDSRPMGRRSLCAGMVQQRRYVETAGPVAKGGG